MFLNDKICVIAASNTTTVDNQKLNYIKLASIAADRAKYYLGVPTYLITDDVEQGELYSNFAGVVQHIPSKITKRNVIAGKDTIQYDWLNDARIDAFNLTKNLAKKILMIDADYMIASDQLEVWLNNDYSFMIFDHAADILGTATYSSKKFPSNDIMQRWATAISWSNTLEASVIFETAKMVRENYAFYAVMLGLPKTPFRNDLAFSVACHLHNIPCHNYQKLWNLPPAGEVYKKEKTNSWILSFNDKCIIWDHDIHILNKQYAINDELMNQLRLTNVKA